MKCDWRSHSKLITENQRLRHGSGTATEDVGHFTKWHGSLGPTFKILYPLLKGMPPPSTKTKQNNQA